LVVAGDWRRASNKRMNGSHPTAREAWQPLPGGDAGQVRADWRERFEAARLRSVEDFLSATGEALSKPGLGTRYRARLRLGDTVVYLKRFDGDRMMDRLRRMREDGKWHTPAERELQAAEALRAAGVPATQALAWGKQKRGGRERSFVVLCAAPGEPADKFLKGKAPATLRKLARGIAALARKLHTAGQRHRDFYLCHIFAAESAADIELTLIDLQRVFRPGDATGRWRVKDLAQLNYSAMEVGVTEIQRLRFFRDYAAGKSRAAKRKLLRAIARKTETINSREHRKRKGK
jgi:heptose I phosphotransferase